MSAPAPDRLSAILELLQSAHSIEGHDQDALTRIARLTAEHLGSFLCALFQVDLTNQYTTMLTCWPPHSGFQQYMDRRQAGQHIHLGQMVGSNTVKLDDAAGGRWLEYYDISTRECPVISCRVAAKFELHALLGCPITIDGEVIGYLDHFIGASRAFTADERALLAMLAQRAAAVMAMQRSERALSQYKQLGQILHVVDGARSADEVLHVVLRGALDLTQQTRGWIGQIDAQSHEPTIAKSLLTPPDRPEHHGQGAAMRALHECQPILADDFTSPDWRDTGAWCDTQSALAVPLVIPRALVRRGRELAEKSKRLAVVVLESQERGVFSGLIQDLVTSLAAHAAVVIERLDLDDKLAGMIRVQQEIVRKEDGQEIVRLVGEAIATIFKYDYVNISIVHPETRSIHAHFVLGLPQGSNEDFLQRAQHSLDGPDIQADIVRSRETEVPLPDDPRFDATIYHPFGHDQLSRVFMPMIAASENRVVGTIEAGHRRAKWHEIYEEDVRILKQFVDYAAAALERRRRGILTQITHELRAPTVGIRSNVSYLQHRLRHLDPDRVQRKFDDILADTDVLLYQVRELEYFLGAAPQVPKIEATLVFPDVIMPAIRSVRPQVLERGLDPSRITFDPGNLNPVRALYFDRGQLRQVVAHLLENSVKYAEDDPEEFRIHIDAEVTADEFIISFQDWGIGIRPEHADRLFSPGVRAPEAIARAVSGSGLGLSIGRHIMHDLGGDLRLAHLGKPTDFQLVLPMRLQEDTRDPTDR